MSILNRSQLRILVYAHSHLSKTPQVLLSKTPKTESQMAKMSNLTVWMLRYYLYCRKSVIIKLFKLNIVLLKDSTRRPSFIQ